jgi:hypothetical protein
MADLNLYTVSAGLRIVSDVSDVVYTSFSTKRNNVSNNELTIIGVVKKNYAEYDIDFTEWDNVLLNDEVYPLAIVLQNALTNIATNINVLANGKQTGTLFGDDTRQTKRNPVTSGKYSQGLPLFAANIVINGTGYWENVDVAGILNGASEFGTGTDADGKIYVSAKNLNRYEAGQLAFYLLTSAWNGVSEATGDFCAFVGASQPGLVSDGQEGDIKEGYMFGWSKTGTEVKAIIRVYKGFNFTDYPTELVFPSATENLKIFQFETGYLGIHPLLLYLVDTESLQQRLLSKVVFNQKVTSVNNPDLAISVYLENLGNTTNVTVRNGSFQYGNYSERTSPDASSRRWLDSYSAAAVGSGVDTVLAVYQVPEKVTMHSRIDSGGTSASEFRNTVSNRLNLVDAVATSAANKPISINVYLVPKADVIANYTAVNPFINVLERATGVNITSVSLANADKIVNLPDIRNDHFRDVEKYNFLLTTELVGVVTVSSSNVIADLEYTLNTEDLF